MQWQHPGRPARLSSVDITQVAPGDESTLRQVWDVHAAVRRFDLPWLPPDPLEELLNEPSDQRSHRRERWVARLDGHVVGQMRLVLPLLDNADGAEMSLYVDPAARRRGVGRALLDVATRRLRQEGRTHVMFDVPEPLATIDSLVSPGPAFAAAAGAANALEEICRVLELDVAIEERLHALELEARRHADGYELVQWVGPSPVELLDDLALLTSRMVTDAPMGDLAWEAEQWDAERVREAEHEAMVTGRQWVTTGARHVASGQVVAYTDIGFAASQPDPAFQWTTIVDRSHRGHRLGALVKVANLRLLRRESPTTRLILTWNADSNAHMIAINDALGFRPRARWCHWQLTVSG
jgi:GNAT superfamily N-acetyltransferase